MRLTIAYSKIKKRNLVLIINDTYQRETLADRPIRQPLSASNQIYVMNEVVIQRIKLVSDRSIKMLGFENKNTCIIEKNILNVKFITMFRQKYK